MEAMNNITLEDEEDSGIALEGLDGENQSEGFQNYNAELCLVGRFITEGVVDFQAVQQTLAALWRPGKGVHIKELDVNLYLFQFFHAIDIKRVCEGSPWTFNRKALIISRMKKDDIPRRVSLNKLDLWVQIHELRPGFMSEKIFKEVGNYIGEFVESCRNNFKGAWKEYMRVRVTVDITKPLKRRMKVRNVGNDWFWIVFKYENVPTFCFICGILGHSEKFCSRLFDTPEEEIIKPYGAWMRAPIRRQTKLIGAQWLHDGNGNSDRNTVPGELQQGVTVPKSSPQNQEAVRMGVDNGKDNNQIIDRSGKIQNLNEQEKQLPANQSYPKKSGVMIIENKKRRTGDGLDDISENANTELDLGLEEDNMDQDMQHNKDDSNDTKNGKGADSGHGVRLAL